MINKRSLTRPLRFLFYVCLDVAAGTATYAISVGEPGLTPGQLAIRILTGMALASAIIGGPDIMLYWQESGQRIKAEDERDAAAKRADTAEQERDAVAKRATDAEQGLDAAAKRADTAEQERDAIAKRATDAEQGLDAAAKRAAAAEQERDAMREELQELRVMVEQLQNRHSGRRSRRRRLRSNGR